MKKYIFILNAISVIERLMSSKGKRVEGVLYVDENTGRLTFKAYNRQRQQKPKDWLLKKLPWGSVRESMERIKVFGSFPKEVGTARVMGLIDEHSREAKNALSDHELIEFC